MGIQLIGVACAKRKLQRSFSLRIWNKLGTTYYVPKGHIAVYVGEGNCKRRLVIPISYLNHPLFRDLFKSGGGRIWIQPSDGGRGLTIPCSKEYFISLTTMLDYSQMVAKQPNVTKSNLNRAKVK